MPRSIGLITLDAFRDRLDAAAMIRGRPVRTIIDGTAVAVQLRNRADAAADAVARVASRTPETLGLIRE
jgi:hypothetical protein